MELDLYIEMLLKLDWFYDYSDDYRVWKAENEKMKNAKFYINSSPAHKAAFKVVEEYKTNSKLSVGDAAHKFRTEIDKVKEMK